MVSETRLSRELEAAQKVNVRRCGHPPNYCRRLTQNRAIRFVGFVFRH